MIDRSVGRWLVESVADLRTLGFFADRHADDRRAAAGLLEEFRAAWGRKPVEGVHLDELLLVAFDTKRVWWEDTEADVAPGNDAYVGAIEGWANVSRGAFRPESVREEWLASEGPVFVHVVLEGQTHTLTARYLHDYLDMDLLRQVNALIPSAPFRLWMHAAFDQTAVVVAVTEPERRRLEERGWSFSDASVGS